MEDLSKNKDEKKDQVRDLWAEADTEKRFEIKVKWLKCEAEEDVKREILEMLPRTIWSSNGSIFTWWWSEGVKQSKNVIQRYEKWQSTLEKERENHKRKISFH